MIKIHQNESLNIVPFIDIMLVLLAIVLSISTFIAQGKIAINLPQASMTDPQTQEKKVSIQISKDNQIYFEEKPINLKQLAQALNGIDPKTEIKLQSDKDAKFERFIQIVEILKEQSHENFSIATKQK